MNFFISFLLILFSCFVHLHGNELFRQLTIHDGLAHTDANSIVQDSVGLIWIGTYGGLQSYDGYSFQTFSYYPAERRIFQSHDRINSMACTKEKIWIGTESGLTCFNLTVHGFATYYVNSSKVLHDFNAPISKVYTTPSGSYLWTKFSTEMVVSKIDNDTIMPLAWENEVGYLLGRKLNNLQFEGETMWGVTDKQIVKMGIRGETVSVLETFEMDSVLKKDESMQRIILSDDFLYVRTGNGCYRMAFQQGKPHQSSFAYVEFCQVNSQMPKYTNGEFLVDSKGALWCAYQKGLFKVQEPFSDAPSIQLYLQDGSKDNLSALKIKDMLIDSYGNLWLGTYSWGVYCHHLSQPFCRNLSLSDFQKVGLSQSEIVSVTGQRDGILYLIVGYTHILKYIPRTGLLSLLPIRKDVFEDIYFYEVKMGHDQVHLYIGSNYGIFIYNVHTREIRRIALPFFEDYKTSIINIYEDNAGRLWAGSWGIGVVCIAQPSTNPKIVLRLSTQTDPAILSDKICQIFINGKNVFLCTTNGLNRIILGDKGEIESFSSYQVKYAEPSISISTDYLVSMDCQNDSTYWIGTMGGGLNKIVLHSLENDDYTATRYTVKDGLSTNDCEIVLLDEIGNVWVGGNDIARLDLSQNKMHTYGYVDGVPSNAFKSGACYKEEGGTLYMGGLYGLSYFKPVHSIVKQKTPYTLIFTRLFVNNDRIVPNKMYDGRILLNKSLDKTSKIILNHWQNNFSVSFAALNYNLSSQIIYRYCLRGGQKDWNIIHGNNEIAFTNLPYGTYELEVQASVDQGLTWGNVRKSLEIEILSPWWLSGGAKAGYGICLVLVAFFSFRQYNKERALKQENENQKKMIVQEKEKYQEKMQLFTNTSHELKTPLTLILLAAEKLDGIQCSDERQSILSNAKHMQALITELIDIKKQDLGMASINLSYINVSDLLRRILKEMIIWIESRRLYVHCDMDNVDVRMDADRDKIGKMMLNLLTNAIKYTDADGQIEISLRKGVLKDIHPYYDASYVEGKVASDTSLCIFTVRDTGIGISQKSIQFIYERFFQVESHTQAHLGSGIGLAIVKSIVLLHKGMIVVSSERGMGTEFIIALPVSDNLKDVGNTSNDVLDIKNFIENQYCELRLEQLRKQETEDVSIKGDLPVLLIVEDNIELQTTLKEQLSPYYNIYLADNGRVGFEKCLSVFPDIIVSDVMMPEMDGLEMCRRIKSNLSIAYIPIVLLTAKSDVESQIEGYESGADLYVPKPFSIKFLNVNLHRLLKQREHWYKKDVEKEYNRNVKKNAEGESVNNGFLKSSRVAEAQGLFIEKLKKIIAENIANPELSSVYLAKELGVSRAKLYRDLENNVDGQSLSDYVRNYRLDRAACLLSTTDMDVQEVMDEVGFVNNSHFTKIFRLRFNMSPTEYKRKY